MNIVRSCFAAIVAFLVVAVGWSATDAVVCCNSSSVGVGDGLGFGFEVTNCQNENRTFHTVEAIGGGTCDDHRTAVTVRKCCPPGRPYDPEVRFCGPSGADGGENLRRMNQRLWGRFRVAADSMMVGYYFMPPTCNDTQVLVDVPAVEVSRLMEVEPSAVELPPDYCFDLTPSDELVARTCRPRDQYCGKGNYTCVNKCCMADHIMYIYNDDGWKCKQSKKPFTMSAYETDADGRPVGRSNSTVLPYKLNLQCSRKRMVKDVFMLTTNGSLYLTGDGQRLPDTRYCVEYYNEARLQAFVCADDGELPAIAKDTRGNLNWLLFSIRYSNIASPVFLALTLLVYNILPSLRNTHNYYIQCYMACNIVSYLCLIGLRWTRQNITDHLCVLYGYFTLYALMTTYCCSNIICFDIYWMLRYNISINRNTSTSVRSIMYNIYCWGFSSIFVCTVFFFEHSKHQTLRKLAPGIGEPLCWFNDFTSYGYYTFYLIPVSVMLTANLILFLLTAFYFTRIKCELKKFKQNDSNTERFLVYKENFIMSIKLFLIMEIPLCFSILPAFFGGQGIIWDIFDVASNLQGVYVFIIFVAKRKVIMELRKKFRWITVSRQTGQINTISGSS
ncbi:unnamed protein product [Macrosiphum euphorbiae]|uniref:G-protein coupled receptors family 2 profile 2 domain-containing protein n=1 Tax=Macrosiphum euphorbiae TaxID=13131 RepID=A0AAV0WJC4_9HEMI|nr:unnamed protein product [Macrosiphum euphorbiae]